MYSALCWCLVTKSFPTLHDPMDWSPPGSSVHGIFLARLLEWVAIPFSRGSSQLRDQTQVSCFAGRIFTVWATREAQYLLVRAVYMSYCYGHIVSLASRNSEIVHISLTSSVGGTSFPHTTTNDRHSGKLFFFFFRFFSQFKNYDKYVKFIILVTLSV